MSLVKMWLGMRTITTKVAPGQYFGQRIPSLLTRQIRIFIWALLVDGNFVK